LTAPQGTDMTPEALTAFTAAIKEVGVTKENAQKVLDKFVPAITERGNAAIKQAREDMLAAAKADQEIGGDKFEDSVAVAKLAINAYFTPAFAKFLNDSGLGNHPEMIRGLMKAGIPLKPDGWVPGGKQADAPAGDARSFYANSKMNP
jgi:hypothetical protein